MLVSKSPLFYLIMVPNVDNSDMSKRSLEVIPLSEKVSTVYCYNYFILLLVIVVNLLLCIICKLNFIIRKSIVHIRFSTICGFRDSLGVSSVSSADKG